MEIIDAFASCFFINPLKPISPCAVNENAMRKERNFSAFTGRKTGAHFFFLRLKNSPNACFFSVPPASFASD
ncbi:MAG: hypothetical protein ACOYI3_06715, partial [Christensenellales bacterium]